MWRLDHAIGTWQSQRLCAQVAFAQPALGVHQVRCGDAELVGARLMQVAWYAHAAGPPARVEDAYVRGSDLIVTYAETAQHPVRAQVYWRMVDEPDASPGVVIEVLVSVQTESLDVDPRTRLATTVPSRGWSYLPADRVASGFQPLVLDEPSPRRAPITSPATALLARMEPAGSCSYGQIVFDSDLLDARIAWERDRGESTLETTHFGARLEKGVLRRIRSRAVLAPRAQDEQLVAELLKDSATAAPPLVT